MAARHGVATVLRHGVSVAQLQEFFGTKWDEANRVVKMEFRDYPFVDGQIVADQSAAAGFYRGAQTDVPMIFGHASHEASVVFGLGQTPDREWVTRLLTQHQISPRFPFDELEKMYGETSESRLVADLYRDIVYGFPAQIMAGFQVEKKKSPVWLYRFGYVSARNKTGEADRAGHSAEVSYLFGTVPRPADDRPTDSVSGLKNDLAISDLLAGYWVNFAAWGNPNRPYTWPASAPNSLPAWPAYDAARENLLVIENGGTKGDLSIRSSDHLNAEREPVISQLREACGQ
jgi:para-nitrobenzyl esterase